MSTLIARIRPNLKPEFHYWVKRHNDAIGKPAGPEKAIVQMLDGWKEYANNYRARYLGPVSEDGFCGPEWIQIGKGIRALFNGELGRLDGGTLDKFYCEVLEENGFNDEGEVV